MADVLEDRDRCRELTEQLVVEYAGAVPPGQVLAMVFRANHALARHLELSIATRMALCESSARRSLTDRIARDAAAEPGDGVPRVDNGSLAS